MIKKMTVLAMAVGIVAAFALPATASANWKHKGANIVQPVQIGFTGTNVAFQSSLGGVECQITSRVQFNPGTTGIAETFVPHPVDATTNCKGTGGLAFCQIHNVEPTNLPWTIHTSGATEIKITSGDIHSTPTGGFCPMEWLTVTPTTVTGIVDDHKVSTVQLSGSVIVDAQTKGQQSNPHLRNGAIDQLNAQVSGLLHVESPNAGTYEI